MCGKEEGWVIFFFTFKNWVTIILLWDFSRKITILWNGLFFRGAKLSVAIFLLIRESFLIICQGPLEPGIAGLSSVHVMK